MKQPEKFHMYIRGIILLGFGMLLFKLLVTGNIENFIAPKMMKFVYFTFFISVLLGSVQIWRSAEQTSCSCTCALHNYPKTAARSLVYYSLFVLPIISAFLFSDITIDGKVAAKRGVTLAGEQQGKIADNSLESLLSDEDEAPSPQLQEPPEGYYEKLERRLQSSDKINVTEDEYISIMEVIGRDVEGFKGKQITFTGFVHREEDLGKEKIVLARYGITCCVADASVLGMLATGAETASLQEGEWVEVTGTLDKTIYIDTLLPIVQIQKLKKVEAPKTPYLYQKF
ncbi:MAG: TIGR03943 family protein [Ectobacillus sp.]